MPRKETILCVDLFQRGLAGIDFRGSKPLDKFKYHAKEFRYEYTISVLK